MVQALSASGPRYRVNVMHVVKSQSLTVIACPVFCIILASY